MDSVEFKPGRTTALKDMSNCEPWSAIRKLYEQNDNVLASYLNAIFTTSKPTHLMSQRILSGIVSQDCNIKKAVKSLSGDQHKRFIARLLKSKISEKIKDSSKFNDDGPKRAAVFKVIQPELVAIFEEMMGKDAFETFEASVLEAYSMGPSLVWQTEPPPSLDTESDPDSEIENVSLSIKKRERERTSLKIQEEENAKTNLINELTSKMIAHYDFSYSLKKEYDDNFNTNKNKIKDSYALVHNLILDTCNSLNLSPSELKQALTDELNVIHFKEMMKWKTLQTMLCFAETFDYLTECCKTTTKPKRKLTSEQSKRYTSLYSAAVEDFKKDMRKHAPLVLEKDYNYNSHFFYFFLDGHKIDFDNLFNKDKCSDEFTALTQIYDVELGPSKFTDADPEAKAFEDVPDCGLTDDEAMYCEDLKYYRL